MPAARRRRAGFADIPADRVKPTCISLLLLFTELHQMEFRYLESFQKALPAGSVHFLTRVLWLEAESGLLLALTLTALWCQGEGHVRKDSVLVEVIKQLESIACLTCDFCVGEG